MYVWSNSPKYICVACRNKIPVADLEAVYREQLRHFLVSPTEIAAHAAAANDAMADREKLIANAERELAKIEAEEKRLFDLYYAGGLSTDDFGRAHRPLSARRTQLEDELPRVQAELDVLRISLLSREEAMDEARDLATRWERLPSDEKRQIVETITDRIVIGTEDVEITLLHLPATNDAGKATRPQGFMAPTSWALAGRNQLDGQRRAQVNQRQPSEHLRPSGKCSDFSACS